MSVPYRLFVSKLMPTDGWEHPEQPVTDSPLPDILQVLHRMSSAKTSCYGAAHPSQPNPTRQHRHEKDAGYP